jgi:hypothetical protein
MEHHPQSRSRVAPLVAVALLLACRPNLPPVSGCTPGASACVGDSPAVCSASQRWQRAGDTTCAAIGGVCVVGDGGIAHCAAPPRDAGADAAEVSP